MAPATALELSARPANTFVAAVGVTRFPDASVEVEFISSPETSLSYHV